jgi:NAD-dependent dihydropyrimidine dehydrogenase PreA subunit
MDAECVNVGSSERMLAAQLQYCNQDLGDDQDVFRRVVLTHERASVDQRADVDSHVVQGRWRKVADEPVCLALDDLQKEMNPETYHKFIVREAAFGIMHLLATTTETFAAASQRMQMTGFGLLPRQPGPENPQNRFPHTIQACQQVLGVPSLAQYEVHVCPEGCLKRYAQLPAGETPATHVRSCHGCRLCVCECGAQRFHIVKGQVYPVAMGYLLHDVFRQFFLDTTWLASVSAAREQQSSSWHQAAACKELNRSLISVGYDMSKVCSRATRMVVELNSMLVESLDAIFLP